MFPFTYGSAFLNEDYSAPIDIHSAYGGIDSVPATVDTQIGTTLIANIQPGFNLHLPDMQDTSVNPSMDQDSAPITHVFLDLVASADDFHSLNPPPSVLGVDLQPEIDVDLDVYGGMSEWSTMDWGFQFSTQPSSESPLPEFQSASSPLSDLFYSSIDALPDPEASKPAEYHEPSGSSPSAVIGPDWPSEANLAFPAAVGDRDYRDGINATEPLHPPQTSCIPRPVSPKATSIEAYTPTNWCHVSVPRSISLDISQPSQSAIIYCPIAIRPPARAQTPSGPLWPTTDLLGEEDCLTGSLPSGAQTPLISMQPMIGIGDSATHHQEPSPLHEEVDNVSHESSNQSTTGFRNQPDNNITIVKARQSVGRPRRRHEALDPFKLVNQVVERPGGLYLVSVTSSQPSDARLDENQPHLARYSAPTRKPNNGPTSNRSRKRPTSSASSSNDGSGEDNERPLKKFKSSQMPPKLAAEGPRQKKSVTKRSEKPRVPEPAISSSGTYEYVFEAGTSQILVNDRLGNVGGKLKISPYVMHNPVGPDSRAYDTPEDQAADSRMEKEYAVIIMARAERGGQEKSEKRRKSRK